MKLIFPAGGWLPQHAHFELMWDDQGRDFATGWKAPIQAPGDGECVAVPHDGPFPGGFGPAYPVVRIDTGPWRGHVYYLGHTTTAVTVGDRFKFGHVLSHCDQGHDNAGTHGGWCELGEWFPTGPGPRLDHHWFDGLISKPFVVKVPDNLLRWGSSGLKVMGLSSRLRDCGYLTRPYWHFHQEVHGAVVAFKGHHKIWMPPVVKPPEHQKDRGIVTIRTDVDLTHAAQWCRKHGHEV